MSSLAVLITLGSRPENVPSMVAGLRAQTTQDFTAVWLCETEDMAQTVRDVCAMFEVVEPRQHALHIYVRETPRDADGRYAVVPYSYKVNLGLDEMDCPFVTYMTDDSHPRPEKYEAMIRALRGGAKVVYVGQVRNGTAYDANGPVPDAFCKLDHTQVAHVATDARWPEGIDKMTLGDAYFWRELHARYGAFEPVPGGILDWTQQDARGITATWR